MSIQSATDRKTACEDADAYFNDADNIANAAAMAKATNETHWWNAILSFTNATEPNDSATRENRGIYPIVGVIETSTLNTWSSALTAQGYVVTQGQRNFTVSLPP